MTQHFEAMCGRSPRYKVECHIRVQLPKGRNRPLQKVADGGPACGDGQGPRTAVANLGDSLHPGRDRVETLINKAELPNSESKFLFYFLNAKVFLEEFENNDQVDVDLGLVGAAV